jgi:hypothetical protein
MMSGFNAENKTNSTEIDYWDLNETQSDGREIENSNSTYLSLVSYPILLVICTIGNALNVIVLSRLEKFQTKEVFLTSLAVSDSLLM